MNIIDLDNLIKQLEEEQKQGVDNTELLKFYRKQRTILTSNIMKKIFKILPKL